MKRLATIFLVVLVVSGCAGTGITDKIRDDSQYMCNLYENLREPVVVARAAAVERWNEFTPEQQAALKDIDERLKDLDRAGKVACAVANAEPVRKVDWDWVKSVLFDALKFIVELQRAGVISE